MRPTPARTRRASPPGLAAALLLCAVVAGGCGGGASSPTVGAPPASEAGSGVDPALGAAAPNPFGAPPPDETVVYCD